MTNKVLYYFEEIGEDLPRPPMAALRALFLSGIVLSPKGWNGLSLDIRKALSLAGAEENVDPEAVRSLIHHVPPKFLKLVPASEDADPNEVPRSLAKALGPARPITSADWRSMRSLDRRVLAGLTSNTRLLWRAFDEICAIAGIPSAERSAQWTGALARCELRASPSSISHVASKHFLDGRSLVLARVAGLRAARKIAELLDLQADSTTGPIELDWAVLPGNQGVLWQAHVSSWEGSFFPAASLLAATTAAAALYDMIKNFDANASISQACIREAPWLVGNASAREEPTSVFSLPALGFLAPSADMAPNSSGPSSKASADINPVASQRVHDDRSCEIAQDDMQDAPAAEPTDTGGAVSAERAQPRLNPLATTSQGRVDPSRPSQALSVVTESAGAQRMMWWLVVVAFISLATSLFAVLYVVLGK